MYESEFEALGLESQAIRRHLPKYADYLGLLISQAARQIIEEATILKQIKIQNNRDLEIAGTAHKAMKAFYEMALRTGKGLDGESMIVVGDNSHYRRDEYYEEQGIDPELYPKIYLHVAEDNVGDFFGRLKRLPYSVSVGRPNSQSHLVLMNSFTVDDYDVVTNCVGRINDAKRAGDLPNYSSTTNSFSIWGNLDKRRPRYVQSIPMEYTQVVE